jgi:predicted PurR-regulated permease PerM
MKMSDFPLTLKILIYSLLIIALCFILVAGREFLYPITLGILFSYLLFPLANFFEKNHFPRILAILITLLLTLSILFVISMLIYRQILHFVDMFPVFKAQALKNIDDVENVIRQNFNIQHFNLTAFLRARIAKMFDSGSEFMKKAISATTGTIFSIGILPVYVFLFLYYRTKFAYFILKLLPREKHETMLSVLKEISSVTTRYMVGISTVVVIMATLNSFGLYLIGVRYPILLGVFSSLFTFIPYVGTLIGSLLPFSFTLLTGPDPFIALRILLLYIITHFIENNILSPNIIGKNVEVNPFFIIVGIIGGGMLWGIPGMFAIVPIMAMFNVLCKHFPSLQAYNFLLGLEGTSSHAITRENLKKFWSTFKKKYFKIFQKRKSRNYRKHRK